MEGIGGKTRVITEQSEVEEVRDCGREYSVIGGGCREKRGTVS